MSTVGVIGGTNASLELTDPREIGIDTPYGTVHATSGGLETVPGAAIVFVRRHGEGHDRLSCSVNHRANIRALRDAGVSAIVATTVCGILDPALALGHPIVFDDLYFPDNRLPEGGPCTFYDVPGTPGRGHLIFDRPFSPALREAAILAADDAHLEIERRGTYAYALGPRFNTKAEIAHLRAVGACAVSQTAGPEAVLAGELEIPYCLIGFGVDYANGVSPEATPVETLDANIALSAPALASIVRGVAARRAGEAGFDTGFVYRFD